MKRKHFFKKSCAVFLTLFYTTVPVFANTPSVSLNGDPVEMKTSMVNGTPYFSLREAWLKIYASETETARVEWYPEQKQVLLFSGSVPSYRINAPAKTIDTPSDGNPIPTDIMFLDGTLMVTPAFNKELRAPYSQTLCVQDENQLHFYQTVYENPTASLSERTHVADLCAVDIETGLPDFAQLSLVKQGMSGGYSRGELSSQILQPENFQIETTTDGEKTIFTYHAKQDGRILYVVTVLDNYVIHVLDLNYVFTYRN